MMSGPFLDVPAGQKVYLELNGHTLHSNVTANDKEAGIGVPATAGLEVTDSVGGGLLRVRGGDFHPGLGVAIFLGLEVLAALAAVALVVGIVMTFLDIADALAEFFRDPGAFIQKVLDDPWAALENLIWFGVGLIPFGIGKVFQRLRKPFRELVENAAPWLKKKWDELAAWGEEEMGRHRQQDRSEASGTGRPSARTSAPGVACLSWSRINGNRDWQRQERVPEASGTQRGSVSH
ncbi:hypothetical protein ACQBAU_17730 [Propionibacteriaceae bacterium Y2011]